MRVEVSDRTIVGTHRGCTQSLKKISSKLLRGESQRKVWRRKVAWFTRAVRGSLSEREDGGRRKNDFSLDSPFIEQHHEPDREPGCALIHGFVAAGYGGR